MLINECPKILLNPSTFSGNKILGGVGNLNTILSVFKILIFKPIKRGNEFNGVNQFIGPFNHLDEGEILN